MASAPITVLLYNGPLLCGFNVPMKGLTVVPGTAQLAQHKIAWCCHLQI